MKWKTLLTPLFVYATKGISKDSTDHSISSIQIGDHTYEVVNMHLSLAHHKNIGIVLRDLKKLRTLRGLDLQYTDIGSLPESIGVIARLQKLNLHGNKLKNLPDSLSKMLFIKTLNIGRNLFEEIPEKIRTLKNLNSLNLSHCGFTSVPAWIGELNKLTYLNLSGNQLKILPKSMIDLTQIKFLDLSGNPNFAFISPDENSLGSLELTRLFKDKVKFSKPNFYNEVADLERFIADYKKLPLYWNLNVLKKSSPRTVNPVWFGEMIDIIRRLSQINVKNSITDDTSDPLFDFDDIQCISNYIYMLYNPRMDSQKLKVYEKYNMHLKVLLTNILMYFDHHSLYVLKYSNERSNFARRIFSSMANAIRYNSIKPIYAMKDVYVMIQNEFSYRNCNVIDFIRNRIEALKEYRFNFLMEMLDTKSCRVLNYWTRELGSILGFGLVFENEMLETLNSTEILNGNHLWSGLNIFLSNFSPEDVITILTNDINKNYYVISSIANIINEDNNLSAAEKEAMINYSFITKNAVKYMLIRLNYLIKN